MKRGVVYACSALDWIPETVRSALSFARHMPDVERHLFATVDVLKRCHDDFGDAFTEIFPLDRIKYSHRPRFASMLLTEFDQVIFIDGDTLLLMPVHELFDVLDHFDIGAAIAPQLFHPEAFKRGIYDLLPAVSAAVPEWNGGLLVANNTATFRHFVIQWRTLFHQCATRGYYLDQASLRSALVTSKLRVATIANIYNFRAHIPQVIRGRIRILHAHGDLPEIAKSINASAEERYYVPDPALIHGQRPLKIAEQDVGATGDLSSDD